MASKELHADWTGVWDPDVGYVLELAPGRGAALDEDLETYGVCHEEVPPVPATYRRQPLLCFLSYSFGKITHVARGQIRYLAKSGWDRLDLGSVIELRPHISTDELLLHLADGRVGAARRAIERGGNLPPQALRQVLSAIGEKSDEAHATVTGLIRPRGEPVAEPTPARTNWAYQRDAVRTALELADIPRDRLDVPAQFSRFTPGRRSIFDDIDGLRADEDMLIEHDLEGADDWILTFQHRYPARTFDGPHSTLTVILANKCDLERQLGVDLIYVNETLGSVVFVQYKTFEGKDGEGGYRPDTQLAKEIARMDNAAAKLAGGEADISCEGYRLAPDPFFFKFCRRLFDHDEQGLVPGSYVPLTYWKRLVADPRVRGPRDGICVTPRNLGRHLTVTAFKDLVQRGWIGTTGVQARMLLPFLKAAMAGDKSVVFAVESPRVIPADGD